MRVLVLVLLLIVSVTFLLPVSVTDSLAASDSTSAQESTKLRIGTYDNRAVAIAYAGSKFNEEVLQSLKADSGKAKEEGNEERVKELEEHAMWLQKKLHFQGFGHASVSEYLSAIEDKLSEVARQASVEVIAWELDYVGAHVETVDVTDLIVAQFDPSAKVLKWVEEVKSRDPISLEELERMDHDH